VQTRRLGKTGIEVSEIGLGCWQLGGDFGPMEQDRANDILAAAIENGVTLWDTADVYGGGLSEQRIGRYLSDNDRTGNIHVVTKLGRGGGMFPDGYTRRAVRESLEGSAQRLGVETIELAQLHCVPRPVLEDGEIFTWLDDLVQDGLIRNYGASVETVDEGLICLRNDRLATLQIIFNLFRQDAAETLLPEAAKKDVGIIVRLPLASGLLSGKFAAGHRFAESDHRNFNRDGEMFNVGETFSGLPFEKGVELVEGLEQFRPDGWPLSQLALRWILDHPQVTTVIGGASHPGQIADNAAAAGRPPLGEDNLQALARYYSTHVREHVRGDI